MPLLTLLAGLALLAAGIGCTAIVGRRRFYRRGPGGVQQFRSYSAAVTTRTGEGCLTLLGWVLTAGGLLTIVLALAGFYIASHP